MKKILFFAAVIGAMSFASCNNGTPAEAEAVDSTAVDSVVADTNVVDTLVVDTLVAE